MTDTYPAQFDVTVETVRDIPTPDAGAETACDWGNPEACQDDNNLRAEIAGVALRAYAEHRNSLDHDPTEVLGDMLNDLRHLCDALDVDFDGLAASDIHYACELEGRF